MRCEPRRPKPSAPAIEAHDALVSGIKAFLADQTVEHEKRLAALEDALRYGENQ
jgi:hypothetical protein